jgi:glyoxylase-like metal-dependent hydrolase (beta-lactamase superfamily II)
LPDRSDSYGPLPVAARPNETIYTTGTLQFGTEAIEYGYLLQAHTDGDIYVFFPQANVLVAGDVACNEGWPLLDWRSGGWIGGMVDGLQKLIAVSNAETRIVPGRGPPLTRADLESQHAMYAKIFERLEALMREGKGPDEALAAKPAEEFGTGRGDPTLFLTLAFQSMWGHFAPNA